MCLFVLNVTDCMIRPCFAVTGDMSSLAGLRSGKLGEQCEAVVLFPKLFQKYPFPILINSAFLKLADIFRLGYAHSQNINGLPILMIAGNLNACTTLSDY